MIRTILLATTLMSVIGEAKAWTSEQEKLLSGKESVVLNALYNRAEVNGTNSSGQTILMIDIEREQNPYIIQLLLENGADPNAVDNDGRTPLMYAAEYGDGNLVGLLIEHQAIVGNIDNQGKDALMYAAEYNNDPTATESLINAGADVNRSMKNGKTALLLAGEFSQNPKVLQRLIENNADIYQTDSAGRNILYYMNHNPVLEQSNLYYRIKSLIDNHIGD